MAALGGWRTRAFSCQLTYEEVALLMRAHWTTPGLILAAAATACLSLQPCSAAAAPPSIRSDAGLLELKENGLSEPRGIFVQRCRRCVPNLSECDVVYVADGLSVAFASKAPTASRGELNDMVLVGLIDRRGDDAVSTLRNNELLLSRNDPSFFSFEHFLLTSVIPAVERAGKPKRRWIVGSSSGGAWALSVAMRQPHVFSGVLAFSPVGWPLPERTVNHCPSVFIGWGSSEEFLGAKATKDASILRKDGCSVQTAAIAGGHDLTTWNGLFWLAMLRLRSTH